MARGGNRGRRPKYEPGESHREKHQGDREDAYVTEDSDGRPLGKCPQGLCHEAAQELLDEGLPWSPRTYRKLLPKAVFNVLEGVPYRAHRRGNTGYYHGFPAIKARIPAEVRDQLRERAESSGDVEQFDAWLKKYENLT